MTLGIERPPDEYARRWARFQEVMRAGGLDGALLVQSADVIYFTGTFQNGHLYIPSTGKPLFMVRRDYHLALADAAVE
ncbi:MAG: aminopeptidase P family N-terminal domain-containing protein, partial [Candidatus Desulforudis sp.]|nr:aminopeptidase P family N-terminal domain-containing protein [Desulforudis sp.]